MLRVSQSPPANKPAPIEPIDKPISIGDNSQTILPSTSGKLMDHDQRFKSMIREFFPQFMQLFLPKWAEQFDFTSTEWLEKEVLPDPPEGERHVLDLVAKLRTAENLTSHATATADEWLAMVHVEIESEDRTTRLKPRLPRY